MRRKRRVTKTSGNEDKKVQMNLRRLGVQPIPGIDEVNLFMEDDETVMNFKNPKVQAAVPSNTFAVTGTPTEKKINELLPGVLTQVDQKTLLNYITKMKTAAEDVNNTPAVEGETEGIPELVPDFEEVSEQK